MDILIDIETLPADARKGMDLAAHAATLTLPPAPSRYKKPESIAAWQNDPANQIEHYRSAVFRWPDVRIGCIGVATANGNGGAADYHVIDCADPDEEWRGLMELVEMIPARGRIFTWGDYDPRILRSRMLYHGMRLGAFGIDAKPWERRLDDLQRVFAELVEGSPSKIRGISVDAACEFLGIQRVDNPIPGSAVLDRYIEGDWSAVINHCYADIRDEWAVLTRLRECGVCGG